MWTINISSSLYYYFPSLFRLSVFHIISTGFLDFFPIDKIGIATFRLRQEEEGGNSPKDIACKKDPQHIWKSYNIAAKEIEQECCKNCAQLASRRREAMCRSSDSRGKYFCRNNKCCGIWAEVEEKLDATSEKTLSWMARAMGKKDAHLRNCKQDKLASCA